MHHAQRRTAPGVRDGRVQRKNRVRKTPHYMTTVMPSLVVDRRRPGEGCRHVVRIPDVHRFIEILPRWDELKQGLDAIVIDRGDQDCMGWHRLGVVAICAWNKDIEWRDCDWEFYEAHAEIFEKLSIPVDVAYPLVRAIKFTEESARAFLLIHVLVHELGHHHDRMTSKSRIRAGRGEGFAEAFARHHEDEIIKAYRREFNF